MAAGGRLRLRACGWCMVPHLRPSDLLHVAPRTASEIAVGDVVVFRRAGRLFGHRAIGKGVTDEGAYVVTRPDQTEQGNDGPSYDRDILGVVRGIETSGLRYLPRWASGVLAWLQDRSFYRLAARCWLALWRPKLRFAIDVPLHAGQRYDLYRRLSLAEFALWSPLPEAGGLGRWTLLIWIGGGSQPAASIEFAAMPDKSPGWCLASTHVRFRFRGTGIDRLLRAKAAELFDQHGMTRMQTVP